ncbi:MAG: hypothetical protein AAB131_17445, partial [Actinomycetota bacterium]
LNFGNLTINAGGNASIAEDSGITLTGSSVVAGSLTLNATVDFSFGAGLAMSVTAASLVVTAGGFINDLADADLAVTGNASFTAGTTVTLGDEPLSDQNYGSLTVNTGAGISIVNEDSAMSLLGASVSAGTLTLNSTGAIGGTGSASATTLTLAAAGGGAIGSVGDPLDVTASTQLDASTAGGASIFLASAATVPLGVVNAGAGTFALTVSVGAITDADAGAGLDVTADIIQMTTAGAGDTIGTAADPIETTTATLIAVTTNNAEVNVTYPAGSLTFNGTLAASGTSISYRHTGGNIEVGAISVAGFSATLTASGNITDTAGADTITASTVTLAMSAGGSIGAGDPILTDAATVVFTTGAGAGRITEANGASFAGTSTGGTVTLTSTTGTLDVGAGHIAMGAGTLNLVATFAGGGMTDTGTITSTGLTTLNSAANTILLDSAGNDFGTVTLTGTIGTATVVDVNSINLGGTSLSSLLTLTVTAGLDITNVPAATSMATDLRLNAGGAIGTLANPVTTDIVRLFAFTQNGGVFVSEASGLIIENVIAREGVAPDNTPRLDGGQVVVGNPTTAGTFDVSILTGGNVVLGTATSPDVLTITITVGTILDGNGSDNNLLAQGVFLTSPGDIGQAANQIDINSESTVATVTASGSVYLSLGNPGTVSATALGAVNDVIIDMFGAGFLGKLP